MPALITFTAADDSQLHVRVVRHPFSIGRAEGNTVRSVDRNVSRHHAVIARNAEGEYEITDSSSYGTFVNGARVTQHELHSDDEIRVGDLVMRFALVPPLPGDEAPAASADAGNVKELTDRIERLTDQVSDLRREVSSAQAEEELARKERDEVEVELKRVRGDLAKALSAESAALAKVNKLDNDLKSAVASSQSGDAVGLAQLQKQLRESRNLVTTLQKQIEGMEERDSLSLGMKKEIGKLTEELRQTRERQQAAQESVGPAMARIEALTNEVKDLKSKLLRAENDLVDARKQR